LKFLKTGKAVQEYFLHGFYFAEAGEISLLTGAIYLFDEFGEELLIHNEKLFESST